MPPRPKTEAEKQKLRMLIIDAARELFIMRGVEAVTMREIAKKIGYSATSIYLHFADKDAVLRAVCDNDLMSLAKELAQISHIEDPKARLLALGRGYASFALQYPNHYRLMFMTPHPPCGPANSALEQNNLEQDAYFHLKSIVNEIFLAKKFRDDLHDPELIAETIWAATHGVCALEIIMGKDAWVDWRSVEKRLEIMESTLITALFKAEK